MRWTVCHVSLTAGMCLPGKLSDVTHSMSPTQKGERLLETRRRRTTLATRNTDTSGNSESVRAPRATRSTTRDCSHTSLCCSRLSNAQEEQAGYTSCVSPSCACCFFLATSLPSCHRYGQLCTVSHATYIHTYTHACMHVRIHTYIYVHHTYLHLCTYTRTSTYT